MTRTRVLSVGAAVVLSLALAGTAFAKGPQTKAPKKERPTRANAEVQVTATPTARASANAAQQGGVLRLNVVLHAAREDRPDTCTATVNFLSGPVVVELTRSGGGSAYHAAVPVAEDEAPGPVSFDATCLVDGAPVTDAGEGKIQAGGTEATTTTESTETPAPEESTDADEANVVVPDLDSLSPGQRQTLFEQLVALLARLLGITPGGSSA